jgi:ArsR family transcriptional regulator
MSTARITDRPARRTLPKNGADAKFRAFSDPTRLRILNLLREGELCVGDLVKVIQVPQPTASRHLAYLRRAGLVSTRKDGIWTFYTLAAAQSPFHRKLLECLTHCFDEVRDLKVDATRAAKLRQGGGCCPK